MTDHITDAAQREPVSAEKMLDLLQCSTCFRGDVCRIMPCACAQSLADAAQPPAAPVETKSAIDMIAACYEGLCPDGSSALDFEWARQRGYILPNNGSGKLSPAQCSAGSGVVISSLKSTKFDEVSCDKPGDGCEWPECECRRKELRGTFACPICGKDTPHHHPAATVEKRAECSGCMNPACEDCFDLDALAAAEGPPAGNGDAIKFLKEAASHITSARYLDAKVSLDRAYNVLIAEPQTAREDI